MTDQAPLLRVRNLTKTFGGVTAVSNMEFDLPEGKLLGVIGPNGSGKTTLVNLITGFVKPTAGSIFFREKEITGWPPYKVVSEGISRTFQMVRPFYQLPAYKNLIVPLYSPGQETGRRQVRESGCGGPGPPGRSGL